MTAGLRLSGQDSVCYLRERATSAAIAYEREQSFRVLLTCSQEIASPPTAARNDKQTLHPYSRRLSENDNRPAARAPKKCGKTNTYHTAEEVCDD